MHETQVHSNNLVRWAKDKSDVVVLSADLTGSTEIAKFRDTYPDRFFNLGMAEQNLLSWAGGMAREGFVPMLHTFAVFLVRRPYDQLAMSVCYPNLPVILVGFLPGIMTPGGVSHQAIEDISLMRGLPNMTVLEVGDAADVESVLDVAYEAKGPVYIRMLRGSVPRLFETPMEFNRVRVLSEGKDVTIISSGICTEEVMKARSVLEGAGISVTHLHATTLKPFDDPRVDQAIRDTERLIVTVENHTIYGGLGAAVSERISEVGHAARHVRIGIPDTFAHGATAPYLMAKFGLDAPGILSRLELELGEKFSYDPAEVSGAQVGVAVGSEQLEAL